jgi:RNA polymerase sigma-70 factor, ECF subfamily
LGHQIANAVEQFPVSRKDDSVTKTYDLPSNVVSLPGLSEQKIISLSQQGDRDAFACLYATYIERIHRYIRFRVTDEELAEDITSHVFLKAWEKLGTYKPGQSPFIAWLYRIARNSVIDHYRTRKFAISLEEADPEELSHTDEVDEKIDLHIQSQLLREALKELTDMQQEVLVLKYVCGFSTSEIALKLDREQGAIRALQMRGIRGLAKYPALQKELVYDQ